jgi:hypothetical protein
MADAHPLSIPYLRSSALSADSLELTEAADSFHHVAQIFGKKAVSCQL